MLHTARAYNGMVVTPHRLASQAGLDILRQGGNAVESAVAAAAVLGVVYPHMTGLGGDGFWLILAKGESAPRFFDACGRSAALASTQWYACHGHERAVPKRGPHAALTVAGAVSGWESALALAALWPHKRGGPLPLPLLLEPAIHYAEQGIAVTASQHGLTRQFLAELAPQPGFAGHFLDKGSPPAKGHRLRQPALGQTLRYLAAHGLDDFYRGECARSMAADLEKAGSPLRLADLAAHRAEQRPALHLRATGIQPKGNTGKITCGMRLFNSPPPTQGLASLVILGLLERVAMRPGCDMHDEAMFTHALVEATKQAFLLRDKVIADPAHMQQDVQSLLEPQLLDALAAAIREDSALPWPPPGGNNAEPQGCAERGSLSEREGTPEGTREKRPAALSAGRGAQCPAGHPAGQPGGDTVWLGAMDAEGNAVSYIQSLYHEFGSGLVLPETGVVWQNRGLGFTFMPGTPNSLGPGKKPFHTLNPAMALLDDGRALSYGTMGGEGQPQTQAAIFARYICLGLTPQAAVTAPRWLLGRSWGDASPDLKLEKNVAPALAQALRSKGHILRMVPAFSSLMGHAGMLVRHPDGLLEGAADPRGDGIAGCW